MTQAEAQEVIQALAFQRAYPALRERTLGTSYLFHGDFFFRPGRWGRTTRPSSFSTRVRNRALPAGRPVVSCRCRTRTVASSGSAAKCRAQRGSSFAAANTILTLFAALEMASGKPIGQLVERWFRNITTQHIRRGSFRRVEALEQAIYSYIDTHNEDPRALVWTAYLKNILRKIMRAHEKLDTIKNQ